MASAAAAAGRRISFRSPPGWITIHAVDASSAHRCDELPAQSSGVSLHSVGLPSCIDRPRLKRRHAIRGRQRFFTHRSLFRRSLEDG